MPEKYNQSDQESFSRREILAHRLRNIGREIIGHHPIPITGPTANVVKVAGIDPFSPNPDEVHGEELFQRAREYEHDRKHLNGEI